MRQEQGGARSMRLWWPRRRHRTGRTRGRRWEPRCSASCVRSASGATSPSQRGWSACSSSSRRATSNNSTKTNRHRHLHHQHQHQPRSRRRARRSSGRVGEGIKQNYKRRRRRRVVSFFFKANGTHEG
ncbi:uncharacterized protein ACA1_115660 [Acanthamoeba castellanii str. Neff]|uniref:Uncharacterized protein n=1 Tax=Acanthamoeba castellanii (strain ATCC 30010 / Neff) TaxID=1257118 RepID=L8H6R1_ACACF|nr:uncharacterized protein ACA1_115660 [Acanthamoeba castellanii str. Neff]ELR20126.1 hypothetical protein ACA1_115660 [Acanthamoeba castellanii str. Neff]